MAKYKCEVIYLIDVSATNEFIYNKIVELADYNYIDLEGHVRICYYNCTSFKYTLACILYRIFLLLK